MTYIAVFIAFLLVCIAYSLGQIHDLLESILVQTEKSKESLYNLENRL